MKKIVLSTVVLTKSFKSLPSDGVANNCAKGGQCGTGDKCGKCGGGKCGK